MSDLTTLDTLVPGPLSLAGHRLGTPQRAGALTMVPISGPAYPGIVPPRTGVKLTRVPGYGRVELRNGADRGVAIIPLHIGYVQDQAQNHALCRSAFLAAGQKLLFEDQLRLRQRNGILRERLPPPIIILPRSSHCTSSGIAPGTRRWW